MVKRLKTVPLQVRISSGLGDALEARVKEVQQSQGLERSYGLKSLAVEEALRLYLEGAPALRALVEEILSQYEAAEDLVIYDRSSNVAKAQAELQDTLAKYRSRLDEILCGLPPLKKEGE